MVNKTHSSRAFRAPVSLAIILIAAFSLLFIYQLHQNKQQTKEIGRLNQKVQFLTAELAKRNRSSNSLSHQTQGNPAVKRAVLPKTDEAVPEAESVHPVSQEAEKSDGNLLMTRKASEFILDHRIQQVEEFMVLTDDQRERLKARFAKEEEIGRELMSEGQMDKESREEAMKDLEPLEEILGEDEAKGFQDHQKDQWKNFQKERLDNKVFALSRKLSLSKEQEGEVRTILSEAKKEVDSITKEMQAEHREKGETFDFGSLMKWMEESRKIRKDITSSRLKEILSDEQYNNYLELDNQAPGFAFPIADY